MVVLWVHLSRKKEHSEQVAELSGFELQLILLKLSANPKSCQALPCQMLTVIQSQVISMLN